MTFRKTVLNTEEHDEWMRMNTIIQEIVSKTGMSWLMASYFASIGWRANDFTVGEGGESDTGDTDDTEKTFNTLEKALLKGTESLVKSVVSGDIKNAFENMFDMIGSAISEIATSKMSAFFGGGMGGSILGAIGGGVVGGLFSLIGGLFGGGKKGETIDDPAFFHMTNIGEMIYQLGFSLPSSFVLSGRSDYMNVGPHGFTLDNTRQERRLGMHMGT